MTRLRIISGGQSGVDRAALDAALALGVPCGGWCPGGRRAEDGPIADKYPLIETASTDYAERTLANVRDSEATLIVSLGPYQQLSPGTGLTAELAVELDRPLFVAQLVDGSSSSGCLKDICDWIGDHKISALNIAGPRESECPGVYVAAHVLISGLLGTLIHR